MPYDKKAFADYQSRRLARARYPRVYGTAWSPVRRLAAAIIGQAIKDLRYARKYPDVRYSSDHFSGSSFATLLDDCNDYFIGAEFSNHCAVLDLDPDYMRKRLGVGREK